MRLENFKPSISSLNPEAALALVLELRKNRAEQLRPKPKPVKAVKEPAKTKRKTKAQRDQEALTKHLAELGLSLPTIEQQSPSVNQLEDFTDKVVEVNDLLHDLMDQTEI